MAKRFKLVINLENDVFADDNITAIQKALSQVFTKLLHVNTFDELWHTKNIKDVNGNTVGYFNIKDEEK